MPTSTKSTESFLHAMVPGTRYRQQKQKERDEHKKNPFGVALCGEEKRRSLRVGLRAKIMPEVETKILTFFFDWTTCDLQSARVAVWNEKGSISIIFQNDKSHGNINFIFLMEQ